MKHKIVIDPRFEDNREGRPKVYSEVVDDNFNEELEQAMVDAEWTDDPGTGRAVILKDGRELLNPIPVAPPASIAAYSREDSVNDLVQRALARHMEMLRGEEDIDSLEDMNDFPEDEDYSPMTQFEAIVLASESPQIPKDAPEPDLQDLNKVEADAKKKAPRAKQKGPPAEDPPDEE